MDNNLDPRVLEVEKKEKDLTSKSIRYSNGSYMTVREYIENIFPKDKEFDVEQMVPALQARVTDAARIYEFEKQNLFATVLTNPKYSQPVVRTKNGYMSFIDYLNGLSVGSLHADGVVRGKKIVPYEEEYNRFFKNVENLDERRELEGIEEPSVEEQETADRMNVVGNILYNAAKEKGYDAEMIFTSSIFMKRVKEVYIDNPDFRQQLASGQLAANLVRELDEVMIRKDDRSDVEKIEEMYVDNGRVVTNSIDKALSTLSPKEIEELLKGFEKKPQTITLGGDEDEEEVEITEPEIPATLQDQNAPIRGSR